MNQDPFARFERSQAGILIPVALFVVGAGMSFLAIDKVNDVMVREDHRIAEELELVEAGERNEIETPEQADADSFAD